MVSDFSRKYVLSDDVVCVAAADLDATVREYLDCSGRDLLVGCFSGTPSYVFDGAARLLIQSFTAPTAIDDAIGAYAREIGADREAAFEEAMPLVDQLCSSSFLVAADALDDPRRSPGPPADSLAEVRGVFLRRTIARLSLESSRSREGLENASACSVNQGTAGIAYFLYRLSLLLDEERLLDVAERWLSRAREGASSPSAFLGPPISLYYGAAGVHVVSALVAEAKGDAAAAMRGVTRFVEASEGTVETIEVFQGGAGALIGCAILLEKVRAASRLVTELGHRLFETIADVIREQPILSLHTATRYLGAAHGWAGILYSLLRWCGSSGRPVPAEVSDAVLQLADLARPVGQGSAWPMELGAVEGGYAGWCHGSAGYIPLWLLGDRLIGHSLLDVALRAGWHVWNTRQLSDASICCGLTGRAFALAALYRATRAREWLDRADQMTGLAVSCALIPPPPGRDYDKDSLTRGSVGVALLCGEMLRPDLSSFPLYELP